MMCPDVADDVPSWNCVTEFPSRPCPQAHLLLSLDDATSIGLHLGCRAEIGKDRYLAADQSLSGQAVRTDTTLPYLRAAHRSIYTFDIAMTWIVACCRGARCLTIPVSRIHRMRI